jgi:hypothetical protein
VTVMSTAVLSYAMSIVLCLCIEFPALNLQKMFGNSKKGRNSDFFCLTENN